MVFGSYGRKVFKLAEVEQPFVKALEHLVLENDVRGSKMFIFTDNSMAEAAFWKDTSKSESLFDLVLCLKELESIHDIQLRDVHVS
jgi:hypothetical protein